MRLAHDETEALRQRAELEQPCCTKRFGCGMGGGDNRLALAALIAFYGLNGRRLTLTNDAAHDLVMSIASGQLDTAEDIAAILRDATAPWIS